MPELSTIYEYMRSNSGLLGKRILQQFPALHQVGDPLSGRVPESRNDGSPAIQRARYLRRQEMAQSVRVRVRASRSGYRGTLR